MGSFLEALLSQKAGPLMEVVVTIAKDILALLGITTADLEFDAGIQK